MTYQTITTITSALIGTVSATTYLSTYQTSGSNLDCTTPQTILLHTTTSLISLQPIPTIAYDQFI
jgi:hypothetical protein